MSLYLWYPTQTTNTNAIQY